MDENNQQVKQQEHPPNQQVHEEAKQNQNQENKGFSLVSIIVINILMIFIFKGIVGSIMTATRGPSTETKYKPSYRHRTSGNLMNVFQPNQEFDFKLSLFIENLKGDRNKTTLLKESQLQYNTDQDIIDFNYTLTRGEFLSSQNAQLSNDTLNKVFLQAEITSSSLYLQDNDAIIRVKSRPFPLLTWRQNTTESGHNLLFDSTTGVALTPEKDQKSQFVPFLKQELSILLVYDTNVYPKELPVNPLNQKTVGYIKDLKTGPGYYQPLLIVSDFWLLPKEYTPLTNDTSEIKLVLHFQNFWSYYFQLIETIKQSVDIYADMGIDMIKFQDLQSMIVGTNIILLIVTVIVSTLHSFFQCFAIKNQIQFWRSRDNFTGISVHTLFLYLLMRIIIFLYLIDTGETSKMVLIPSGLEILVEMWKINKSMKLKFKSSFPFVQVLDKNGKNQTSREDQKVTKVLSIVLIPLVACVGVYKLFNQNYSSWFSFIIRTLAMAVYVFGFILMVPQVYLNYKLKSVEHLPWRMLFYRFLNTIIDDLFAFIISMPTMHRLACFRDDIIFVIFLVQMWIYRKNPKRKYRSVELEENETKPLSEAEQTDTSSSNQVDHEKID